MIARLLVAGALVAVLLCGVVTAGETQYISVLHAGKYDQELGEAVKLSGMNRGFCYYNKSISAPGAVIPECDSGFVHKTYITLEKVGGGLIQNYQVVDYGDNTWSYKINSLDLGTYRVTVRMSPDGAVTAQDEFKVVVPTPEPTPTPTPTPTPNYEAKIAALETKIAAQETKINTQSTRIQEIADKTPVPTAVPTTVITTKTPVPTATIDHAATIAALEKHLAEVEAAQKEQGDWIRQIMKFLGMG